MDRGKPAGIIDRSGLKMLPIIDVGFATAALHGAPVDTAEPVAAVLGSGNIMPVTSRFYGIVIRKR